jgi:NAD(P)H-flavin reductase
LGVWLIQILGRTFGKTSAFKISSDWLQGYPLTAQMLPGEMVKLDVFVPHTWTWQPGQHVFLRFTQLNPFDNHPFTIASVAHKPNDPSCEKGCDCANIMTFYVRAQYGSTRQMLNHLDKSPDAQLSVIVDGPYGTVARRYENCAEEIILIAGGNGISASLPWLLHLSRAMRSEGAITQRVRLLWMIRKQEHIEWAAEELQKALSDAPIGTLSIDVYVTNEHAKDKVVEKLDEKGEVRASSTSAESLDEREGVELHFVGRPNLQAVLPTLVGGKRTAVLGCGPEGMKVDVSNAVAKLQSRVLSGKAQEVSLHTETFDW